MDSALLARVERVRANAREAVDAGPNPSATGHQPEGSMPAYPIDVFPPALADFISEATRSLAAPPEMIGLPLSGFAAAAIGNTRYVAIKRDWHERPILWCAVVAEPGTAKSPAIELARKPLAALQRRAKATWEEDRARFARDLAEWDNLDKKDRAAIAKPQAPSLEHFYTTDSTKEALALISATSPGLAVYRDELTAWVNSFDAYRAGRGGDRQDMLSLWSGSPLKIDRKRDDPLFSDRPTVSVVGGVQPDRLGMLAGEAGNDGFLDRFLWAYPEALPLRLTSNTISEETEEAACAIFARLRVACAGEGFPVRLSPEAWEAFKAWHDGNADLQQDAPPVLRGLYAKLPTQAARVALVLHCLWYPEPSADVLSGETMEDALSVTEFHRAHAGRVLSRFGAVGTLHVAGVARRIVRALERAADQGEPELARTGLHRALGNSVAADDLSRALAELEDAGLIERVKFDAGEKRTETWRTVRGTRTE